ncbi:hypothetical protein MMPV_005167 [Pyropia vietnamensis]
MSFYCALSGTVPTTPVAAKTTGHVYEKALILRHLAATNNICPVTSAPLTPDDLLPLVPADAADGAPRPVPATALSLPAALDHIRGEWEALVVEAAATRRAAAVVRGELAHALYQYDAASRVIGRLVGERDDARAALAELQAEVNRGVARATAAAAAATTAAAPAAKPAVLEPPAGAVASELTGSDADGEDEGERRPLTGGPDPKKRKTITVASPVPDRGRGASGGDNGGNGAAKEDLSRAGADTGTPAVSDAAATPAGHPPASLPADTLSVMEATAATLQARRKARVLSPDLASAAVLRTFTAAPGVLSLPARVTAAAAAGGGGVSVSGDGGGGDGGGGGGSGGSGRGLFALGTADGRVAVVSGGDVPGRVPVATVAMKSAVGGMAWHPGAGLLYAASATTGEVACWRLGDAGRGGAGGGSDDGNGVDLSGSRRRNGPADGAAAPTRTLTPGWSVGAVVGGDSGRDRRDSTDSGVCALAAHPAGGVLLAATPRRGLLFLSTDTGSPVAALPADGSAALCAGWHPDGLVAGAGHADGAVRLWDIKSGAAAATLVEPPASGGGDGDAGVTGMVFSENGYYVVTAAEVGVRVWDLRKLGVARSAAGGGWAGRAVALDTSGLYAAVVGGRGVTVAEVKKLKVLSTPSAGGGGGVALWGPDARWLAVGGEDPDGGGVVTYYASP